MKTISAKLSFGILMGAIAMSLLLLACGGGGGGGEATPAPNPAPVPTTPLGAPTTLQAQALSQTSVRVTWSDNSSDEEGFYVERKTASTAYARVATLPANTASYDDSGLAQGTAYTYRVVAYLGASMSGYSNEASVTTQGQPPVVADFIINHQHARLAKLNQIPAQWITVAKSSLVIAYWHTSHGSQINTGMDGLISFPAVSPGTRYCYTDTLNYACTGIADQLKLRDRPSIPNASDLGNPNRTVWAQDTRAYLNAHPEVNVVMWSWCRYGTQVSTATEADINTYLNLMNQLESEFPTVKFVYMTGPLDGTGVSGNLHQRNEQIRNYCRANDKILYDFADIESFDPDGVNFLVQFAEDTCAYTGGNWALQWQGKHIEDVDWYDCSPVAHTEALNGNLKAYAAWWLWARLAGWDGN
jgi:hypothetical protein